MFQARVSDRAEVRNRDFFNGRLMKEEKTNRCKGSLGEMLKLLECRMDSSTFPVVDLGEFLHKRINAQSGTLARPAQQFWLYLNAVHAFTSI